MNTDKFTFRKPAGSDTIADYALGATKAASEKIYLCGADSRSGADDGSNYVITPTEGTVAVGKVTLTNITTSNTNFANLHVICSCSP